MSEIADHQKVTYSNRILMKVYLRRPPHVACYLLGGKGITNILMVQITEILENSISYSKNIGIGRKTFDRTKSFTEIKIMYDSSTTNLQVGAKFESLTRLHSQDKAALTSRLWR